MYIWHCVLKACEAAREDTDRSCSLVREARGRAAGELLHDARDAPVPALITALMSNFFLEGRLETAKVGAAAYRAAA